MLASGDTDTKGQPLPLELPALTWEDIHGWVSYVEEALPLLSSVQSLGDLEEGALNERGICLSSPRTVIEAQSLSSLSEVRFQTHTRTTSERAAPCWLRKMWWKYGTAAVGGGVKELAWLRPLSPPASLFSLPSLLSL